MVDRKFKKIEILFLVICIVQLFYIFHFRSGFQYEIIKNPFKENSGIHYAVSPEILETNAILKKQSIKDFNLSKGFENSNYLYQRTIEFNYPIRINKTSKYIFFINHEKIPEICKVIETGKYLKLAQC